jgi:hypothetical protein
VSATADTLVGPQHPAYDYRLSGKGDLVLTEVNARTAIIELPPELPRVLVLQPERGQVLAEVGPGTARRVAVAPGEYALRAWRGGKLLGATVRPRVGAVARVAAADFSENDAVLAMAKGSDPDATLSSSSSSSWPALLLGFGAQAGVAEAADLLPALRLGVATRALHPLSATLALATRQSTGFRESFAQLLLAKRFGWQAARRLRLLAGVEAGGGVVAQAPEVGATLWSAVGTAAATVGAQVRLTDALALSVDGSAGWTLLRRETHERAFMFLPTAWIGLVFTP